MIVGVGHILIEATPKIIRTKFETAGILYYLKTVLYVLNVKVRIIIT